MVSRIHFYLMMKWDHSLPLLLGALLSQTALSKLKLIKKLLILEQNIKKIHLI